MIGQAPAQPFQILFSVPITMAGFDYASSVDSFLELSAYGTGGQLLETLTFVGSSAPIGLEGFAGIEEASPIAELAVSYIPFSDPTRTLNFSIDNLEFEGSPVPEPACLALSAGGLFGIVLLRRRRQSVAIRVRSSVPSNWKVGSSSSPRLVQFASVDRNVPGRWRRRMYERFFGLTKPPFSLVSDPSCIHLTAQHAGVIRLLALGVLERKGYLVLTGEAGLGKTTALRALSQVLSESSADACLIFAPTLSGAEFLEMVLLNFGLKDIPPSKARRLKLLEELLLRSDAEGRVAALVVDEAHQLSPELLEELRLLGNFEALDHRLLQIVLVGQEQLNDQLNLPELWQFKQRISVRLSLRRLDPTGVEEYIRFRWAHAGGVVEPPFDGPALDAIATWSLGIPRLINNICDKALLIAFSETSRYVTAPMVREACEELLLPTPVIPLDYAPVVRGLVNPPQEESGRVSAEEGRSEEDSNALIEPRSPC